MPPPSHGARTLSAMQRGGFQAQWRAADVRRRTDGTNVNTLLGEVSESRDPTALIYEFGRRKRPFYGADPGKVGTHDRKL